MAPIGRRAKVRSIARLEPPVPGRASHGKLLRLRVATFEAPKLVRAKHNVPTLLLVDPFPFPSRFFLPRVVPSSLSADGDIPFQASTARSRRVVQSCSHSRSRSVLSPSYTYIGFVKRRARDCASSSRHRCFFPAVKSSGATLRIPRPPPGVVTCFYCD